MKDGSYRINLAADGYAGQGELNLSGNRGQGHDGRYRLDIHVLSEMPTLTALVNIQMHSHTIRNARIPGHYSLEMTGNGRGDGFTLIGIGPLGLIIELNGTMAIGDRPS